MNNTTFSCSLLPLDFQGSQIRVFTDEQGIGNPRQAMTRLDDDERGVIATDTLGGV